jgi:hypothetical protein
MQMLRMRQAGKTVRLKAALRRLRHKQSRRQLSLRNKARYLATLYRSEFPSYTTSLMSGVLLLPPSTDKAVLIYTPRSHLFQEERRRKQSMKTYIHDPSPDWEAYTFLTVLPAAYSERTFRNPLR